MDAKTIITRALQILESETFVSKADALYSGGRSTADKISTSFESSPDIDKDELDKYDVVVDEIISWVTRDRLKSDYMTGCYNALETAKTAPEKTYGLLASLANSFKKNGDHAYDTGLITIPNDFLADPATKVSITCTVLKVNKFNDFRKIMMVSGGYLVSYSENNDKVKKTAVSAGDKLLVNGTVSKNKFNVTPFETTLTRVTVKKLLA